MDIILIPELMVITQPSTTLIECLNSLITEDTSVGNTIEYVKPHMDISIKYFSPKSVPPKNSNNHDIIHASTELKYPILSAMNPPISLPAVNNMKNRDR